jgi:DNA topoisomerase-1
MAARLKPDEARLYRLIWQRAIASQMKEKELETATVDLAAGVYALRASATRTLFDGFAAVYSEGRDDAEDDAEGSLPPLAVGDATTVAAVVPTQHFTEPPPRFTEASLIKALEENGIGRPSTYAATITTIVDRGYVLVRERRLHPELVAEVVTDLLVDHFGEYVDLAFTARMEEELDEVARGERAWVPLLAAFYGPLRARVDEKRKELKRADFTTEPSDEVCSEGHPMVIRLGRNGRFLACSLFPEHKESRPIPGEEPEVLALPGIGEPCPTCGEADGGALVAKRGRFGPFVGCNRYPACAYIKKDGPPPPAQLPFEVACPSCREGRLMARRARRTSSVFWGCSRYPKCTFTTSREPLGPVHDPDGGPLVRADDDAALCLGCGATVPLAGEGLDPGRRIAGGTPNPAALLRPARGGRGRGGAKGRPSSSAGRPRRTGASQPRAARPA